MLKRDDIIDAILRHIQPRLSGAIMEQAKPASPPMLPRGRLFLSEHDIKKRLTPQGKRLKIPGDAIISPLAADWLVLQGIEIVRE